MEARECESYSDTEINKCLLYVYIFFSLFLSLHFRNRCPLLHTHRAASFLSSASRWRRWRAFACFLSSFLDLEATFRANSLCFSSLSLYWKNRERWIVLGSTTMSKLLLLNFSNTSLCLTLFKENTMFVTTHFRQKYFLTLLAWENAQTYYCIIWKDLPKP